MLGGYTAVVALACAVAAAAPVSRSDARLRFAAAAATRAQSLPPPCRARKRQVRVRIVIGWTWSDTWTRLDWIRLERFPRHGMVFVACHGRRCSHPGARRFANEQALRRGLRRARYQAGDEIKIVVTAPGDVSQRAAIYIRNAGLPTARLLYRSCGL